MDAPELRWLRGTPMAAKRADNVNLDALIPRLDFETHSNVPIQGGVNEPIPVSELQFGKMHYRLLRKPFFQRDTDDWSIDNVVTLIKSFRDGDLIPALIVWRGDTGYTFVIDGAHRLGALIAWVNNDFGAGSISQSFFRTLTRRQVDIDAECKRIVAEEIGTYADLSGLLSLPTPPTPEQVRVSANLAKALVTQTVLGNAQTAVKSFLAINQRSVPIDQTEKYMIEHIKEPNVIAARALVRSARGWQYWNKFTETRRAGLQAKAQRIYNAIYEPEDADPASSIDLQPAGPAYTANGMRLALELVNLVNGVGQDNLAVADEDGSQTERHIEKTLGVVKYIAGKDPASLNLHPAVYFWGDTGNHQPNTFISVVAFFQELILKDELIEFVKIRAMFEEFLVTNINVRAAVLARYGGWKKSRRPIREMLRTLFDGLRNGMSIDEIEGDILNTDVDDSDDGSFVFAGAKLNWRETKSALRRRASLDSAMRCPICKARMVLSDASDDHKERRTDGGDSTPENAQLTHRFCNHGFKEHFLQRGLPLPEIPWPSGVE
jgi:hypothetical protein